MIREETLSKLNSMKMHGFAHAFTEQLSSDQFGELSFEERVGLLIDHEWTERETRKLTRRLQQAKFREQACVEAIDFRHPRGLDRAQIQRLATCRWVKGHQNLLVTGKTGVGKTFIACALAHKACREGYSSNYQRLPRLLNELAIARADGSLPRLLTKLAKVHVLVIDDWGLSVLGDQERRDLLEVIEDRVGRASTIIASQLDVKDWHAAIGEPTVADALLDRLVHNAHRIALNGDSLRRKRGTPTLTEDDATDN